MLNENPLVRKSLNRLEIEEWINLPVTKKLLKHLDVAIQETIEKLLYTQYEADMHTYRGQILALRTVLAVVGTGEGLYND